MAFRCIQLRLAALGPIHFAPENGVYVYSRYDDTKTVLILLNKSARKQSLKMDRFAEVTGNHVKATDILTGNSMRLENMLTVPAKTGLILELE